MRPKGPAFSFLNYYLVESGFQNPDERTSTAKAQDWAVNLGCVGHDEHFYRRDGGR